MGGVTDESADLAQVEQELTELRKTVAQLRRGAADDADGPGDSEDRTASITEADEQEALIAALERRRDALRQRLSGG
jgi:hypothetical protein